MDLSKFVFNKRKYWMVLLKVILGVKPYPSLSILYTIIEALYLMLQKSYCATSSATSLIFANKISFFVILNINK